MTSPAGPEPGFHHRHASDRTRRTDREVDTGPTLRFRSVILLLGLWGLWGPPFGILVVFFGVSWMTIALLATLGTLGGILTGLALWLDRSWARRAAIGLAYAGALNIPVGTIVGGWCVHVLRNPPPRWSPEDEEGAQEGARIIEGRRRQR